MRFDTRLVTGQRRDGLSHVLPIDLSTTYRTPYLEEAVDSIEALAEGEPDAPNPIYARLWSANVRDFEERMTALEGGADSVAFASGMAAITALLLEARERGPHVVAIPPLYGGTHHLLESGLLGHRVTWAPAHEVAAAIRPDTGLVLLETPANPTLTVTDIARVVEAAGPVPVAVDSTFATPVLQRPLEFGASYVVHSATKFLGGHGDAMGGIVVTRTPRSAAALRRIRIATGAVLHPVAAHTFARGLQTLGVRVRAQQDGARMLANLLRVHPEVLSVHYPGLDETDQETVARQMDGPGTMLSLRVRGGAERADAFISALRLAVPAVSLGAVDTLVQRPAALTHHVLGEETRAAVDIPEDLVRISVGLEHPDDLWEDFSRALAVTRPTRRPSPGPFPAPADAIAVRSR